MSDEQWRTFFLLCTKVLGPGSSQAWDSQSWCAWTTFGNFLHYWAAGVPSESEIEPHGIADGGTWGQPFPYQDLAHIAIPAEFYWEHVEPGNFRNGTRRQELDALSSALTSAAIKHRKTKLVLELKFY
jgi:hypothetical protein